MISIGGVREKADSFIGCLSHLKKSDCRRRYAADEDPLKIKNLFVSDEAKIVSSKSFRTLEQKTQVFTLPKSPLIRSRRTHVMEVAGISAIASEMLGLNTDLVRAAAIGHDLGHVPFGHQGESWMRKTMGNPKFCHEIMSVIVAQKIERRGKGLNLTHETLEAILNHSNKDAPEGISQEARLLRYTDKFSYIFADINDIIGRMRYPASKELLDLAEEFGSNQRERTTTAIAGLVIESAALNRVSFIESHFGSKFDRLRTLMYEMYPHVTQQNVRYTMEPVLECLAMLNVGDPFLLLSLMTDKDVIDLSAEPMKDMQAFNRTAISEIVPYLHEIGPIDLCNPDLDW